MFVFKRRYHNGIKNGQITETIRFWLDWKANQISIGKLTFVYGLGYILVESMDKVMLSELTQDDARRCGEENLEDFKKVNLEIYAKLFPEKDLEHEQWYRLRFKYMYEKIPVGIDDA